MNEFKAVPPTSNVLALAANIRGRDFVIGDLHGSLDQFQDVLEQAAFDHTRDRVFSPGDLVDRGPDSLGCLRLTKLPWFYATWGNHEAIALKAIKDRHPAYQDYWDYVGGRWGRGLSTAEREEVVQMLMRLPVAICVGSGERRFNVLHAEFTGRDEDLYSGSPFIAAHLESIVWGNSLASRRHESEPVFKQPGLSTTYVGHTVVKRVASIGSLVYLDTGAYRQDGRLTMLEPRTGYQYTAKKKELELA